MILKPKSSAASMMTPWCTQVMVTTRHWAPSVLISGNGGAGAGEPAVKLLLTDLSRYIVDVSMRHVTRGWLTWVARTQWAHRGSASPAAAIQRGAGS